MPRFLNTWTGEFELHPDPSKVTYAILSHVWRKPEEGGEQSYDDVRKIQAAVRKGASKASLTEYRELGTIFAHRELSRKIKGFCKVAREAGFRLAWNDACCIDKTSSAELSEAINSMYEWYRLSDMCYVYLADVRDGEDPTGMFCHQFWWSKWHYRGWTLQELIAPEHIIFLTRTWNFLGTKMSLAKTLESITGVDFGILTGRTTLDSVSVARRMSWAAKRETTRVEDRAYSLFGIFGLHMSPIYGEGEHAFLRLEEEIIRTIPDQSIFAWGDICFLKISLNDKWSVESYIRSFSDNKDCGLLTSSLTSFSHCSYIEPIASSSLAKALRLQESHIPPVHCLFTPEGVSMRLVCLPLSAVPDIQKAFQESQSPRDTCSGCTLCEVDTLALLQCQERYGTSTTSLLGLPLHRSGREGARGNRRAFRIGGHSHHDNGESWRYYHVIRIEIEALMNVLKRARPKVEDVTVLHHYSGPSVPKSLQVDTPCLLFPLGIFSYLKHVVFEISPHSTDGLRTLGIDPSPLRVTRLEQEIILETTLAFHRDSRAGPTVVIALRLSITTCSDDKAEANLSVGRVGVVGSGSGQSSIGAAAGASHHTVVNTPHISGGFLDLDHPNDSRTIIPFGVYDTYRRTIFYMDYTVQSEGTWGNWARLLKIALQHPFASFSAQDSLPSNLWVSIDLSERFPYVSRTESALDAPSSRQTGTEICERDSDTSNGHDNVFPSCESSPLPVSADQEHAVNVIRDDFEALKEDMNQKMSAVVARLDYLTRSQRLGIDSCEHSDDDWVSPSATHQIPVMLPPSEPGDMATLRTLPERSDNSVSASAINLPGRGQVGPSDVLAEPQPGQKGPHKASLYTYNPLEVDSSHQEHSNPSIPGSRTGQSCNDAGHEGRRDGSGTTADWTCTGSTGDEAATVSEQDQNIQSSGESEDSSTRRAATTLPDLAKLDSVAREAESARSENTIHAVRDTVETLRRENDALRTQTSAMGAQIAGLEATNAETRAQMSELRAQMAQMLSLLNTPAAS